jgi:signal transduction histidine kinase
MLEPEERRPTLLVIDDERDILDAVWRLFRKEYEVLRADSVERARELLDEHDVEVVLADQRLPRHTGLEYLTELRQTHPEIVRVLFTGYTNIDDVIDAINEGHIYRYIAKPWRPAELKLFIAQAFEYHRQRREREELIGALGVANARLEQANAELTSANERLEETDRLRTVFMEVVSHELNTPIAIINGYTYLLKNELDDALSAVAQKAISRVEASAGRLKGISDNVFKVFNEEGPAATLRLRPTSPQALAQTLHEHVEPFLLRREQRLVTQLEEGLPELDVDPEKLMDALVHLVMNAIKFSRDGETISLSMRAHAERPGWVTLEVVDHGVGISSEDASHVFSAFFSSFNTGHHSSGDFEFNKRGIGLGLSVAKRFVEMHGGTISARSEPGEGSIFTIELPSHRPPV